METVTLTIDGRAVTAPKGATIWEAARATGVEIPALCHKPALEPVGVCRICAVDVKGRVLAAACSRAVEPGMEVRTATPEIEESRRVLVELLMADHPAPCARQAVYGDCELERLAAELGVARSRFGPNGAVRGRDDSSPVIAVDHSACILCDRCVRACGDIQVHDVIGRNGKGPRARIGFDDDRPMGQSTCVSCGECVAACPTGALVNKPVTVPFVREKAREVAGVCPYCGVGCGVTYVTDGKTIVEARGRAEQPASQGRLCVKGRYGFDYAVHPQRLTAPLIRRPEFHPKGPLSGEVKVVDPGKVMAAFREATWDEALDVVAKRLLDVRNRHGASALAGFGSAKCSNEEAYVFQKLVRAVFGTNNVDHCTRLCHASSVAALLEGIGSGAVSNPYGDVQFADVVLTIGTNTAENHPVAATFLKNAVRRGTKLIVVDPRRSPMAEHAAHFVAYKPGTDVAFLNGLMHVVIAEGLTDEEFIRARTTGFDALRKAVAAYDPETVSRICGVPAEVVREVALAYGRAENAMILWGMGISQHTTGTDNARCLIALCLITGNVGRRGTGLHPLRGQNNVQGASDAGLIPFAYPGYQRVENEEVRRRFEAAWGVPLDPRQGLTVVEVLKGALAGKIRGMYMMGENPFLSDPNVNVVRQALASLEFLVAQDIFLTETAEFADVVLPATSFFEKEGTYTNTDRRVQIGRKVLEPPGRARLDWEIVCDVATRMGYPMTYGSAEEVFREMVPLTPGYQGITYERIGAAGFVFPEGREVLFEREFPTGRGRLVPCEFAPAKELPDTEYPFVLNTGRVLEHWHTGTMTRRSKALDAIEPEAFVEIHPEDAEGLGVRDGELVRVASRRGTITLPARVLGRTPRGSLFIPFHFREAAANVLTIDELDPFGKIPEYKFCAVRVQRGEGTSPA